MLKRIQGQLLNLVLKLVVFSDGEKTTQPRLRDVDGDRQMG
jgi:hypothetical protein